MRDSLGVWKQEEVEKPRKTQAENIERATAERILEAKRSNARAMDDYVVGVCVCGHTMRENRAKFGLYKDRNVLICWKACC